MREVLTRRGFFTATGGVLAGGAMASSASTMSGAAGASSGLSDAGGFVYKRTKPLVASKCAYEDYAIGSCMYAVFKGVVSVTMAKGGPIYYDMFKYGHTGCGGYGTLCGTCNGGAAAMGVYVQDKEDLNVLIEKLFKWYESTAFPIYKTGEFVQKEVSSKSGSVLCHVSMTKWCQASGFDPNGPERKLRCSRLSADVAGKAVELLNEYFSGASKNEISGSKSEDDNSICLSCHGSNEKSDSETQPPVVKVKMNCVTCHDGVHDK